VTKIGSVIAAATISALAATSGSIAEEFPQRTIEAIFPWSQGAAMAASQVIAKAMGEQLGETVTIVSTPGAAGTKAFKTAMSKPADGYTIIDGYVAPLVLQPVLGNADWTYKDFIPLHSGVSIAFSLGTGGNNDKFSSFEEMMGYCKENPGELRYSTDSRNNLPHMVTARVLQSFECVAQNIPYTTDGDALKDLRAGILDFAYVNARAFIQDPAAYNIMLVMSDLDSASETYGGAPNVKDMDVDLPLSGLAPMGWSWWVLHPDTPEAETKVLQDAMVAAMATPEVKEQLSAIGFQALEYGPEEYDAVVGPVADQLLAMKGAIAWEEEQLAKLK